MDVMSKFSFEYYEDPILPEPAENSVQFTGFSSTSRPSKATVFPSVSASAHASSLPAPSLSAISRLTSTPTPSFRTHGSAELPRAEFAPRFSSTPVALHIAETPAVIAPAATLETQAKTEEEPALFEAPQVMRPAPVAVAPTLPPQMEAKLAQFASLAPRSGEPVRIKPIEIVQSAAAVTVQQPEASPTANSIVAAAPEPAKESAPAISVAHPASEKSVITAAVTTPEKNEVAHSVSFEDDLAAFTAELTGETAPAAQAIQAERMPEKTDRLETASPYVNTNDRFSFAFPWKRIVAYAALFFLPIGVAGGINAASSAPGIGGAPLLSAADTASALPPGENIRPAKAVSQAADDTQRAQLASAPTQDKGVDYELSLSSGFLRKAIQFSNSTVNQTAEDKNRIISLLNQALEAANRAIQNAPNDARAYTTRGRVYQATSVVKPEMKTMADADFAKAKELGAATPTAPAAPNNPMELLPTEQASAPQTAMIGAPNGAVKQTVSSETADNTNKGKITLQSGQKEKFVSFPGLKQDTKVYVQAEGDSPATFFVKNKQAGKGFTIAATEEVTAPTIVTWWEIL